MRAPTLMSIREIKHDIYENYPYAIPFIASIKQKSELQSLLTDLRFENRSSSYSINNNPRQQDDMDIQQQTKKTKQRNRTQYSLNQDDMDIQQSYQQALKREEQRLARQARQRERAEARRREEQKLARQEAQRLAEAARKERQRKMRQQASRRNTTSSTTSSTTTKKPRLTQQEIRQIENVVPGDFKLGAKTVQQLSDKNLKEKAVELTKKMTDKNIRKNPDIKVPTTRLLHAVNAEIVKRKI